MGVGDEEGVSGVRSFGDYSGITVNRKLGNGVDDLLAVLIGVERIFFRAGEDDRLFIAGFHGIDGLTPDFFSIGQKNNRNRCRTLFILVGSVIPALCDGDIHNLRGMGIGDDKPVCFIPGHSECVCTGTVGAADHIGFLFFRRIIDFRSVFIGSESVKCSDPRISCFIIRVGIRCRKFQFHRLCRAEAEQFHSDTVRPDCVLVIRVFPDQFDRD